MVVEKAYAKLNLSLNVLGKRPDGFHYLESIMVPVCDLYDTLEFSKRDDDNIVVLGMEIQNNIVVKAFKLFHDKHSDSELWLIGDGELKSEIERLVKESGLENCVKFKGLQSNVYGYLHDADIFTLPSNYEGIPMTLIEAMGTGLPIVATAVGGVPDMLTDGENALLVENNAQQIADAFEAYYVSRDMRESHGIEAKKRAVAFSAKTMAEKYVSVYRCNMT
jgi:glycosyltransferase involved in cell wall biosynthesis